MEIVALKCNDKDNVAVVFSEEATAGSVITVRDKKGNKEELKINQDVPYGHKAALKHISKGEEVIKYGEVLGVATKDIEKGDYVHVHNLDSQRGRGDLKGDK